MDSTVDLAVLRRPAESLAQRDITAQVAQARERLARLPGSRHAFGVIRMWPDQPVAEHENVARLRSAAELIGVRVIELDSYGRILGSPGEVVSEAQVDFVLHLHFETAKAYDTVSIGAMWNPLSFYSEWGFNRFWANQMSHDIFATTGAPEVERMIRRERGTQVASAMPLLNHTLAAPIYAMTRKETYRAFYCGINWEKVDGRPGRHGELLSALDAKGKLDLYGPEVVGGVKVWDGYAGYRGSLPFDGKTIIAKIAEAGACLVFSSDAHKASGIMSNRLFEALAAGAVVIGDEHEFIPHAIGTNFIRVPSQLPVAKRTDLILEALAEMERNPERAVAMARAAQDRLLEKFFLSTQIAGLFEAAHRFRGERRAMLEGAAGPVVDIVVQPVALSSNEVGRFIQTLSSKLGEKANILLLVAEAQAAWFQERFGGCATVIAAAADEKAIAVPSNCLDTIAPYLKADKVAFFLGIEDILPEPYLAACLQLAGRPVGRLGHLIEHYDDGGKRHFDYQAPQDAVEQFHPAAVSALVFDRRWLTTAPHLPGLSWKGLVRIAEGDAQLTASSYPTALTINVNQYEWAMRVGANWGKSIGDEEAMVKRFGAMREEPSSGTILRRTAEPSVKGQKPPPPPPPPPPLSSDELIAAFQRLSEDEKRRMGLAMYHSLHIPGWVRRSIRSVRRVLGVK